ncbi:MAG: PAS domain S-box protein [Promethearchaeota archaeon]|nr:MAG: PAS domain S-box protein [Candidatus Lokiarchaeota archaeon]
MTKIVNINNATLKMFKSHDKNEFIENLPKIFSEHAYIIFREGLIAIIEGKTIFESESVHNTLKGDIIYTVIKVNIVPGYEESLKRILVSMIDITEKKKAEQKLKASEEKYRNLVENSGLAIVIFDKNGKSLLVNSIIAGNLGKKPEDLIGKSIFEFLPRDKAEKYLKLIRDVIESKKGLITEDTFELPDGSRTFLINIQPIFDIDGNVTSTQNISLEITKRKRAQQKLKASEEKYRNIIENTMEGYFEVDLKGNFTYFNDSLCEMSGYTREESQGTSFSNYMTEENSRKTFKVFNKVYNTGIPEKNFQYEFFRKNGKIMYGESSIYLRYDSEGNKIGFSGFLRDITEKKETEQNLKESEEKFRTITEQSLMGILILQDDVVKYVNKQYTELVGYETEEIKSWQPGEFFKIMHPEDRDMIMRHAELRQKGLKDEINHYFHRVIKKTGEIVWCEIFAKTINYKGRPADLITVVDKTDVKEGEEKLKESEEKFRNITEQSLMGVTIVQDNKIKYINQQVADLSGYTIDEVKTLQLKELFESIHPEDKRMVMEQFMKKQEGSQDVINHYQYRIFNKKGKIVWLDNLSKTINYMGRPANLITVIDITERKLAEERLKESEEKFRTITEQSLMGVTIIQDNKVQYINQQFAELSGYTIDEAKSLQLKEIYEVIHPEDRKMVMEQFMKKQEGSQDVTNHYQYRIIKKTGEIVWLDNFSKTINFMGRPADLVTVIDITERKLAEERLKESQEKYKNMINDLDLGFFQAKWDGTILNVNPAFRMIMGYSHSEELIGKKISFFLKNPEDQKKYSEELLENNIVDNYITHGQNVYGEELILQTDSHLKRDEDGNPMEIEGTIADITERFKLEQKLKLSEERYRFLFENSPLAIILSDLNGVIREINPATEKLIGYSKKEVIGRSYLNLSIIHPDDLPIIQQRFRQYIKGETAPPIDVKFYRKDGSLLWANINSNIIKIGNETFLHVMCQDITERKKAELLVKEEIEKLKELDQIRKDLISRVSHELKTPLIPVLGGVEYLLYSYSDKFEKEQIELLEMIQKGGKRLGKLVERLLDITRIEYDKLILNRQLTNLSEIIKETANDMKYLIKDRKINLNLVVPEDLFLEIDGMRMEQVITNLLSNALKNTPPNGRVSLGLEKYGNWAIISVSDTGVGFTEDEMKKIFTKFGKIERQGEGLEYINMEGSGLGLFITKQIVDLHGGKIWVESTGRNRGCIFKVRLPII